MKYLLNQGSKNNRTTRVAFYTRKIVIFIIGLVAFGLLSGCGTQAPPAPTVDETKVALEVEATAMRNFLTSQAATLWPTIEPAVAITPSTPIPTPPTGVTPLLTNENEGYALRYPVEYHVVLYGRSACFTPTMVIDSRPGPCHVANAFLEISDAAGQTLAEAADEVAARGNPDIEVTRSEIKLGGEDAIVLDNIYSYDVLRMVVTIHNDRIYTFTLVPWVEGTEAFPKIQTLYTTLTESFTFLSTP